LEKVSGGVLLYYSLLNIQIRKNLDGAKVKIPNYGAAAKGL